MKCLIGNSCDRKNRCCHYCKLKKKCWQACKDDYKECKYFVDEVDEEPECEGATSSSGKQ